MKKAILIQALAITTFSVSAQTADLDTLDVQMLNEVVIEAPKVIHKADMDVYHPSQSAIDNSKNGV